MYTECRSGNNKTGCKSLTSSPAGSDQTLCATSATLAANAPTTGIGTWTIVSGAGGSFVNANSPTTVFNGVTGTSYNLRWTISNGVCASTSDDVQITFNTPPTVATAGADQTLCSTSATLAGNTPGTGTGQWTILSGAGGSFALDTNPTTTFTGTPGTTYVLQWTITNGSMYTEFRSGNNKTGCKSLTSSWQDQIRPYVQQCHLSSKRTDDRYRYLDDREWSRRKFCKCKQSDDSLQWRNGNDIQFTLDDIQWGMCKHQ